MKRKDIETNDHKIKMRLKSPKYLDFRNFAKDQSTRAQICYFNQQIHFHNC